MWENEDPTKRQWIEKPMMLSFLSYKRVSVDVGLDLGVSVGVGVGGGGGGGCRCEYGWGWGYRNVMDLNSYKERSMNESH